MYCNYVFESGGIRGLAYLGALRYFEERGYNCFRAAGCSVGAIFASLVVAGFKVNEIKEKIDDIAKKDLANKNTFKDGFKGKGIFNINNLESKLNVILKEKKIEIFRDVKFGDDYLLKIIVTDNKNKRPIVIPDDLDIYGYDKDTFKIATAVVMSCSIPIFYSEYKYQNNRFVDGGATCKFPDSLIKESNIPIYGLKINNESRIFNIVQKVFYKPLKNQKNGAINIINIEVKDIKSIQFNKGLDNKEKLYYLGYRSVKKYFQDNLNIY